MPEWTCPDCDRTFGRTNAGHTCSPTMDLAEWLETSPPHERPVAERLIEIVEHFPDAFIEPVQVGLFVKRTSNFAQLRTRTKWTALSIKLPREVSRPEPSTKVQHQGSRFFHTYNLSTAEELTESLEDLIAESYEFDA